MRPKTADDRDSSSRLAGLLKRVRWGPGVQLSVSSPRVCLSRGSPFYTVPTTNTLEPLFCAPDAVLMWMGDRGTYPLPDGLLAAPGQCQVDAVQCHPVNLLFPAGPVPPHEGVAVGAHVLVIAVPVGRGMSWGVSSAQTGCPSP